MIDVLPHGALVAAVDALRALPAGWLEGHGIAPEPANLRWLANEVVEAFPDALADPSVAPTEEGHVIFEWIRPEARVELEFNFGERRIELYATNLRTGEFVEESFVIDECDQAFARVSTLLMA